MIQRDAPSGKKAVVTGGAGFIGSHLTERLLEEGFQVTVLDDLSTGKRENLPASSRLELLVGDINDRSLVDEALAGCSVVFHLAAVASVQASVDDPLRTHHANLTGTITLLEAARRQGAREFVLASSAAVYGDTQEQPIGEATTPRPLSPYAADKLASEHYLAHYHRQGWLRGRAFRFFNVFGPRQDPSSPYSGVISIFAERAARGAGVTVYGDGRQSRDFIYVKDVTAILAASPGWPVPGELQPINIGRGERVDLLELLETIEGITGRAVERTFAAERPGDIRHSQADNSLLRAHWQGRFTPFETGLRATLAVPQPAAG